ncbi:MAG TPA: PEGA domain-containing protein, partial [Holophagaceae bacterium]|nr:PEGA domain-containing protein [Holophagaceae bacterium]
RVLMDGVELGRTPLPQVVIRGHAGKLRVEKPDYLPLERTLARDEDRLDLKLTLAPFQAKVVTEPAGAEVRLDGQPVGTAPVEIQVPGEGRHTLEVRADGYEPWSSVLARRGSLPEPIRLRKRGTQAPAKEGKVKKFFKDLLDK